LIKTWPAITFAKSRMNKLIGLKQYEISSIKYKQDLDLIVKGKSNKLNIPFKKNHIYWNYSIEYEFLDNQDLNQTNKKILKSCQIKLVLRAPNLRFASWSWS
jgi:hypothetical protein